MIHRIKRWIHSGQEASHLQSGRWGEEQAVRYLKRKQYKILGQRIRVGRHDELDIVAGSGNVLLFIEVKTRKNEQYGRPFSAVNKDKRKRISRAAIGYLKRRKLTPEYIRFDVIEVIGEPAGEGPVIRHIENAFQLDSSYKLWW